MKKLVFIFLLAVTSICSAQEFNAADQHFNIAVDSTSITVNIEKNSGYTFIRSGDFGYVVFDGCFIEQQFFIGRRKLSIQVFERL